jgi:hypothetical protein
MALSMSPAGLALNLGGVADAASGAAETDEERRKRLLAISQAQSRLTGAGNAYGAALSPAGAALGLGSYSGN